MTAQKDIHSAAGDDMDTNELFGKEKISKVLLKIAPPVMLAQLIQALYNIVDSLFVGNYSDLQDSVCPTGSFSAMRSITTK